MATKTKKEPTSEMKSLLGPLWSAFNLKNVWEIVVDAYNEVYYIDNGKIVVLDKIFKKSSELDQVVSKLLAFHLKKKKSDELSYFFNLDQFTKIAIVLPPLSVKGPSIVITKLPVHNLTLDDLITFKALDTEGKDVIEKMLASGKGFIVAGNMGSGKTTMLNLLVNGIPQPNRVVTLERSPDLIINRPHVCRIQSQTHKAEEMIELVGMAERMRADYLVLSDCVGPEFMPFMEIVRSNCIGAMLTTGESVFDTIKRLETKAVISSDGMTLEEVRYAIAQSFKYILFQEKTAEGRRQVSSISELSYESGELKVKAIYKR
nr:Flp pilus assembly complex ATPase component TadA [Bacteriovorax sp. HI3]